MNIDTIPLENLALALIPVLVLILVMRSWSLDGRHALYGVLRMVIQLLLIGYVLAYIFDADSSLIIGLVLIVMIVAASWIALGNMPAQRMQLFVYALCAIALSGGCTLFLITQFVLSLDSWWSPRHVVPLAGMIFAASMNSVSLAGERLISELGRDIDYLTARSTAINAALIPNINALFAVGLVSLPGMMTGQILSGISPFIAARYQLMVMCMLLTAAGFSAILFLVFIRKTLVAQSGSG